jgi:hypothetical protein
MHPRAIVVSIAAVVGGTAMTASLPSRAQGAIKPVEALVVNPSTRPVPVTVLSTPAQPSEGSREIYSLAVQLGAGCALGTVPTGKRLVLQYLSGQANTIAPAALMFVGIRMSNTTIFDVVVPAAPPLTVGSSYLSAAGQQVHAYFDGNFEVCAQLTSADPGAAPFASLRGYLVNRP